MTDFSIDKTSQTSNINSLSGHDGEYYKLKKKYDLYVKKINKSDFANSPTGIQKRLELLSQLKAIATNNSLREELTWIEAEEKKLCPSEDSKVSNLPSSASFYKPISKNINFSGLDVESVLEKCKDTNGKYDVNVVKIVMAFKEASFKDGYFIPFIVKKCRDLDGNISQKNVEAIETLASAGVSPSFLADSIDSFFNSKEVQPSIDSALCACMLQAKSLGLEDFSAFKLASLLNSGYEDKDVVIDSFNTLLEAHISSDVVCEIIKNLTAVKKTGEKFINPASVRLITDIKESLKKTRANEKNERLTPIAINNKSIEVSNNGDTALYMRKDGTFEVIYLDKYSSVEEAKKGYEDLINQTEDNILLEFIKKYKNQDGSIKSSFVRIFSALRSAGITYEGLFDLSDLCVDEFGKINNSTLRIIRNLKSSGALSKDIKEILSSVKKTPEGLYDENSLQDAYDLSSAVFCQPLLTRLLSEIESNPVLKSFVTEASPYFYDKSNVFALINMAKSDGQNLDSVALEILDDMLFSDNNDKTEITFLPFMQDIFKLAKGSKQTASEAAEKICCTVDLFRPDEVKTLLELSLNSKGDVDEKLSDAIYKLYHEGFGFNVITAKIEACKKDGNIDYDKLARMI